MTRTGCVGCPFNKDVFDYLDIVEQYEPNMSRAARSLFSDTYEYTKQFHQFRHRVEYGRKIDSVDVWQRMFRILEEEPDWSSTN